MTRAAKVVYFGALLIGLSFGAFFGFHSESSLLVSLYDVRRLSAREALVNFSNTQYRQADAKHADSALNTVAAFLEDMERLKPEKTQKIALAMTYTRLALLQDAEGNARQSDGYMVMARSWYKAYGGRDYPVAEMKARVKSFDEKLYEADGLSR